MVTRRLAKYDYIIEIAESEFSPNNGKSDVHRALECNGRVSKSEAMLINR